MTMLTEIKMRLRGKSAVLLQIKVYFILILVLSGIGSFGVSNLVLNSRVSFLLQFAIALITLVVLQYLRNVRCALFCAKSSSGTGIILAYWLNIARTMKLLSIRIRLFLKNVSCIILSLLPVSILILVLLDSNGNYVDFGIRCILFTSVIFSILWGCLYIQKSSFSLYAVIKNPTAENKNIISFGNEIPIRFRFKMLIYTTFAGVGLLFRISLFLQGYFCYLERLWREYENSSG